MICNIDKLYGTIVVITNNLEINKHGNKHLIEFPQEKVYIKRDPISLLVDHEQIIHSFKIKLTIISIYQSISIALFTTESFKINCSILPSEERIKCLIPYSPFDSTTFPIPLFCEDDPSNPEVFQQQQICPLLFLTKWGAVSMALSVVPHSLM